MSSRLGMAVGLGALAVFSVGGASIASAEPAQRADAALRRALQELVTLPGGPPGAAAIVQRGNRLSLYTAGVADVRTRRRIRLGDHMRVASVAKAYSGAVALALVSRGRLALDDTIGTRLPELPRAWAAVTLRQLLNHTSGLPDFSKDRDFLARVRAAPRTPLPPRRLLQFVFDKDLEFRPGSRYEYSNSDNIAVGLMAAAATGRSYERELRRLVLARLRLRRTRLPVGARLPSPYIHGYDVDPPDPPEDVSTLLAASLSWASGGIVSTPAELNRFVRAYAGGRLFGHRARAQQLHFVGGNSEPRGPGTNSAGLAIFRYRTRCGTVYGHTGNTPGYTQFAAATRDGRRSVTVSINTQYTPAILPHLRRVEELAVCTALSRG
ncbi:MAG: beta-lactamase family protein [Actinomycetota bacterium]|nr:beta-lactamase family protein [Actinomycetota bacterium]